MNPKKILRKPTVADLELLRRIGSPVITALEIFRETKRNAPPGQRAQMPAPPACSNLEAVEVVWTLCVSHETADKALALGRSIFSATAVREMEQRFKPRQFCKLVEPTWLSYTKVFNESEGKTC